MGVVENNSHPRPSENSATILQNGGLLQQVQPENDIMLFIRKLMAKMNMMSEDNKSQIKIMDKNNSRIDMMSREMDTVSRKMDDGQ